MLSNVQCVTSAKRDEQSALSDPKRANKQSRHGYTVDNNYNSSAIASQSYFLFFGAINLGKLKYPRMENPPKVWG
jgi:hypothetical protein